MSSVRRITDLVRRTLTPSFLFSHVAVPLGVMALYFTLASMLLPPGVNQVFAARSAKYSWPIVILLWIAFFAVLWARKLRINPGKIPGENASPSDLILLLLPLAPVVQYIVNNDEILSWVDALLVLSAFALLAAVVVIIVPILLGRTGSARPVMYLGLAFAFTITYMASLSRQFAWHENGSLKVQLPVFGGVWLLGWLLFRLKQRKLMHFMIAASFLANSTVQIYARESERSPEDPGQARSMLEELVGSREPPVTPNIYLLVYDAYVVNETMLAYGIDNRAQERYLEEQGFTIYPHTYSVEAYSVGSMSPVLNASYTLEDYARRAVSGDGVVQNLLRDYGYKTYGVFPSDYYFRGILPSYDYAFPGYSHPAALLSRAILEGEFRFDIGFDDISRDQFLQEKDRVLSELSEDPRFLYTHSTLPGHTQTSGACLPNEVELFRERLAQANLEMRNDIETVIENDPGAIVIVAGDHGPHLTKNCASTGDAYEISEITRLDIQDRFGTFLAIRWPTASFEQYDEIVVLQDLFPAIFAYMFADRGLLEGRGGPPMAGGNAISGATVVDGLIVGGIDDGEPLFTSEWP
jgi:hypothetical protein